MLGDREIWACANHVLTRYGADAAFHAAQRADELLEKGDLDGHRVWLSILDRVSKLEAQRPASALH